MDNIHQILKQYWGFNSFRPLQQDIIRSVLQKKDTLALLPTGGGKSVCFQVPALATDGLCLVISPLIALMRDQVRHLQQKGIKAAAIYTGMPYRQIDALLDSCIYGGYKFLYISPERLNTEDFQARLEKMKISILAVDEAHCISQWGYDFRPSYQKIASVHEKFRNAPVIALTATATPEVVQDIQDKLKFRAKNVFRQSFVRKNLSYVVRQTPNKNQAMADILNKVQGSAIVYAHSRRKTKEFSDYLNRNKIKADYYHAGLKPDERSQIQDNWVKNKTRVICCTNAFGMGIDKPDVRMVLHLGLTESIEAYFQEAGRAGRDESKAYAVQLIDNSDIAEVDKKISESFPAIDFIKSVYESLCQHCRIAYNTGANQSFDFDIRTFSAAFKLSPVKVYTAIKLLEQQELIYLTESIYGLSQVKAVAHKDVMHKFQSENVQYEPLIKFILRTSEGVFEDFVPVEEEAMAMRLKVSVTDIVARLNSLHKFGIFNYRPRSDNPKIIFLRDRVKKEDLYLDNEFIKKRKANFEEKLKAIRYYVTESNICRTRLLVKYFGENVDEDCGICDVCLTNKNTTLNSKRFSEIVAELEAELKQHPLAVEQLKKKLQLNAPDLNKALEFLFDAGKIQRTAEATLKWVE